MYDAWRPPARGRSPPRTQAWEDRQRRQSSPARMEGREDVLSRRNSSRNGRAEEIPIRSEESQPWIHPERRDLMSQQPRPPIPQPQPILPPPHPEPEVFATQPRSTSEHFPTFHAINAPPLPSFVPQGNVQDDPPSRRSLKQSVREKDATEKAMQNLSQQDEANEHVKLLPQVTSKAEVSEKVAWEGQTKIHLLESRQHSAQSTPRSHDTLPQPQSGQNLQSRQPLRYEQTPTTKSREVIPPEYAPPPSTYETIDDDLSSRRTRWDQKPTDSPCSATHLPPNSSLARTDSPSKYLEDPHRAHQKQKKKQAKNKKTSRPVSRDSSQGTSLTALTSGEKHQFLNQMARHAAEIVFGGKGQGQGQLQAASTNYTAAVQGQGGRSDMKGGPMGQVAKLGSLQSEKSDAGVQRAKGTGDIDKGAATKLPTVDITTASTTLSIMNKPLPQIDGLLAKPDGILPLPF